MSEPAPLNWTTQQRAVSALKGCTYNPRRMSAAGKERLLTSLRKFNLVDIPVVNADDTILSGHQRVALLILENRAAELIDVRVPNRALTEEEAKEYMLQANNHAGEWDQGLLAAHFNDTLNDTALGMDDLLAEMPVVELPGTEPDDVPPLPTYAVSEPGDVWVLDGHRLMCGDSTSAGDMAQLMQGQKAQLLHADPPYGMGKEKDGVQNDNLYESKLDTFQLLWWATCRPHLLDNAGAYIWGNAEDLWRMWYVGGMQDSERLTLRNEIVWDKGANGHGVGTAGLRSYFPSERCLFFMIGEQGFNTNQDNYWEGWEPIRLYMVEQMNKCGWTTADLNRITGTSMGGHWVSRSQWMMPTAEHYAKLQAAAGEHDAFKREHDDIKREHDDIKREFYATRAFFDNTHDNMTDVWAFPRVLGEERHGHATPKPVAMMARAIKSSSERRALVLEPFNGSGTTLIACEAEGRYCRAMELTPKYVDVTVERWQKYTGKKAVHEASGRTFDEVAASVTHATA